MKRLAIAFVVLAVALLGNVTFGQEAAGIPDEIIKEIDTLAGTWKVEGKLGGKEHTGGFTCRWARTEDKKQVCLMGNFSYKTGDVSWSGVTLIGWNAAKKCIEDRGFDDNGGNATLCWTVVSPTHYKGEITLVQGGKTITGKADLIKKGPAEIVLEAEMDNGDVSRVVFRKVKQERKVEAKK